MTQLEAPPSHRIRVRKGAQAVESRIGSSQVLALNYACPEALTSRCLTFGWARP